MKALFLTEVGKTEVREVLKPVPGPGEVLLKIGVVGFCGGDLNGFKGLFELQEYPNILGHEIGATIETAGPDVPLHIKQGMRVTVYPYLNCGKCISCRKGHRNACQDNKTMGVRRPGAMTSFITVPWQDIFISENLTLNPAVNKSANNFASEKELYFINTPYSFSRLILRDVVSTKVGIGTPG